jgi:pimeloyl-ACP methyl ester carboxylesterase
VRRATDTPVGTEERITISSGALAYTRAGEGPPVILIHGLGSSRRTWHDLIGPLSQHYTVIAVDLPGHGDSEPSVGGYSPGAHAAAVRDLMVALDLPRASLVGHSMGGGIAVQFAYQFPQSTARLGLISSAGFGAEVTPLLRAAILPGADAVLWALGHLPTFFTRTALSALKMIARPGTAADATAMSEDLRGMADPARRHGFLSTARTGIDRGGQSLSAAPFLAALVDMPVFLAWGTGDRIVPPDHQLELARSLPTQHVVEIVDAGHYPQESHPQQVLTPLLAFLASAAEFTDTRTDA